MTENRVSFRYARALLETAVQEKVADTIYGDFIKISGIMNESAELRHFTSNPVIQQWKKEKVFKEIFEDKVSKLSMSFMLFLLDKKRGEYILSIINQYFDQYNRANNRLPVQIVSTVELSADLKSKLLGRLTESTGKTLLPEFGTDDSLQGGLLVKIDDKIYDYSVKRQLQLLHKKLVEEGIN